MFWRLFSSALACAALTGFLSLPSQAKEEAFELSMVGVYTEHHPVVVEVWKPWIQEMEERSGGRLKIIYYTAGTICTEGDILDSVKSGIIDIGSHMAGRYPAAFRYTDIGAGFVQVPSSHVGSQAYYEYLTTSKQTAREFAGLQLMTAWTSAACELFTTSKPVRTLEDMKGLKLGYLNAGIADSIAGLNGMPVATNGPDMFMHLQRNVIDGIVVATAVIESAKLDEVCKYRTGVDVTNSTTFMVMNKDRWNSLPDDLKNLLSESTGHRMAVQVGDCMDRQYNSNIEYINKKGMTSIELAPEEYERWNKIFVNLQDMWVEKQSKRGLSAAREELDAYRAIIKKYAAESSN